MNKTETPLVSICVTFFSAGRYIHRFLDSCLNQTYRNIEVVIIDDASTDDAEAVIKAYLVRDPRIKYFRNHKRIDVTESLAKAFELAQGTFMIWPGADDWFARDFIANGVRGFARHPEAAGIIPKIINLHETNHNKFEFISEFGFPSGVYSSEWYARRLYKDGRLGVAIYGLMRREDMVSALDYYIKNLCYNSSFPGELRELAFRSYGADIVFFLEILSRYKNFVFDNSLGFMKITHSGNNDIGLKRNSASHFLKDNYYVTLSYKQLYELKWHRFYRGMKIYSGAGMISTALIYFLRSGLKPSFLDTSESKKMISGFFSDFSFFEITAAVALSVPRSIFRFLVFIGRGIIKGKRKDNESIVFIENNFLDAEGRFTD